MTQTPEADRSNIEAQLGPKVDLQSVLARFAIEAATDHAAESEALPEATFASGEAHEVLGGKAALVTDAEVSGLWHFSSQQVERFTEDKAAEATGKFGHGVYFGSGDLAGETVNDLKSGGHIRHDVTFNGNVVVLDREDIRPVLDDLRELNGFQKSRIRSSTNTGPLTDSFDTVRFGDNPVDAVMIYMDKARETAEFIVSPHAVDKISLVQ